MHPLPPARPGPHCVCAEPTLGSEDRQDISTESQPPCQAASFRKKQLLRPFLRRPWRL